MWDLPGPGLEPVSPALAEGFPTTAPPGKPPQLVFEASMTLMPKPEKDFIRKKLYTTISHTHRHKKSSTNISKSKADIYKV